MTGSGSTPQLNPPEGQGSLSCSRQRRWQLRHELGEGLISVVLDSTCKRRGGQVNWLTDLHPLYLPLDRPSGVESG